MHKEGCKMSDVVKFKRAAHSNQTKKFEDDWLLKWCAEWRAARAQQQKKLG
jgi:hypothetical protein